MRAASRGGALDAVREPGRGGLWVPPADRALWRGPGRVVRAGNARSGTRAAKRPVLACAYFPRPRSCPPCRDREVLSFGGIPPISAPLFRGHCLIAAYAKRLTSQPVMLLWQKRLVTKRAGVRPTICCSMASDTPAATHFLRAVPYSPPAWCDSVGLSSRAPTERYVLGAWAARRCCSTLQLSSARLTPEANPCAVLQACCRRRSTAGALPACRRG